MYCLRQIQLSSTKVIKGPAKAKHDYALILGVGAKGVLLLGYS